LGSHQREARALNFASSAWSTFAFVFMKKRIP
jgi:hypothetical protein